MRNFKPAFLTVNAVEFIARLGESAHATKTAAGFACRCPAHADGRASLSVADGRNGAVLLKCHAGCTFPDIVAAAGLKPAELFSPKDKPRNGHSFNIVATYDYQDADGALVFQVCRLEPKDFRQRRPDGKGGWVWNMQGVKRVLYRLPAVLDAVKRGLPLLVAEGEKDCAALVERGFCATTNPGGAGKWTSDYTASLRGADVFVLPDNDEPGAKHGQLVASNLRGVARSVRVVNLPPELNGRPVKDAADYFAAGASVPDMVALLDAAPAWTPPADEPQAAPTAAATEHGSDFERVTAEMRGRIVASLTAEKVPAHAKRAEVAAAVVDALNQIGRFFYHAELRDFDSAMVFLPHTGRLEKIRSDSFQSWLSAWTAVNRTEAYFRAIAAAVEDSALAGTTARGIVPEAFWTSRPGAIYMSNGDARIVKITAGGVSLVDNGTDGVLFASGSTLAPWRLTEPRDAFETCRLFAHTRCTAAHGQDLLRLWTYSLPTNPACKPPLCLAGEIGSGKTRTAKGIAEFYGLHFVAAKVEEQNEADFWPNVNRGGLYTLDNADTKCRWLADALAAAATAGCSQRRKLYSNAEVVTLRANSWLAVTTANPTFAADGGLSDRILLFRMARRDEQAADSALTDEILTHRDAGLSHVAQTLAAALADTAPVPASLNQRHPDFAAFAVRIGRALGREAEAVAALRAAERDKSAFCTENDSVAAALLAFLHRAGRFEGTAAELVPKLVEVDGELAERLSAKRLGKRLSALWPHLQKVTSKAKREVERTGATKFTFEAADGAGFAGFQTAFS